MKKYKLFEKYNEIWDKATNIMKKAFDTQPVFEKKIFEN